MGTELYLDTARLGRMCPGARLAEQEFGWLVSRLGSSLYLEQFLMHGVQSLPVRYRRRVPHLQCWRGVAGFRQGLAEFVSQPAACETHCFTQSSSLLRFAADCLFDRAYRVLVTDLGWPAYTATLHDMAFARRKSLHVVSLKDQVLHDGLDENDLIEQIVAAYQQRGCDAIFLSDISYLGMRLPIESILARLNEDCKFSVVDGAQAFNQRPVDLSRLACDLYLAGSQKWLCSYHPLRMAFVGRQRHAEQIEIIATRTAAKRDAIFNFCRSAEGHPQIAYGETVNVSALIAAAGALHQMSGRPADRCTLWNRLTENASALANWLTDNPFVPVLSSESLRSGILLLRNRHSADDSQAVQRADLAALGLIASTFAGGLLRLSMPTIAISLHQMSTITRALHQLQV
jgi:aspartate aminotransferase-like enzyme